MAYHGLSAVRSEQLLSRDFGAQMRVPNPAATVAGAGRVMRYVGDFRALVRTSRRGVEVVSSNVPLRAAADGGAKRPVDLSLRSAGGLFVAVNPVERVSIAKQLAGGVTVGPDGIRVTLQGTHVSGTSMGGQSIFYAGVGPDEDASIAPRIKGAEFSTVLRSRLSPQQIVYRLSLPAGASLAQSGGGAVITRAGEVIAQVPAPTAVDAQNSFVPVWMRVSNNELVLSIPHRSREVAYPIYTDPRIITYGVKRNTRGWGFYTCETSEITPGPAEGGTCQGESKGGPMIDGPESGVLTAPEGDYGYDEIEEWSPGTQDCEERMKVKPGLIECFLGLRGTLVLAVCRVVLVWARQKTARAESRRNQIRGSQHHAGRMGPERS